MIRRSLLAVALAVSAVAGSAVAAQADTVGPIPPLPPPSRVNTGGYTDCGFITPQAVAVAFFGPQPGHLNIATEYSDGTVLGPGDIIEGEAAVVVAHGGCGLSIEISLQSKYCSTDFGFISDCSWKSMSTAKYTYGQVPTNGVEYFPSLQSMLRPGVNSYRLAVTVNGFNLAVEEGVKQPVLEDPPEEVEAEEGPGAIGFEEESETGYSQVDKF